MNEQLHPPGMEEDPADAALRCAWCGAETEHVLFACGSWVCEDCEAWRPTP